jgi:hypothetical protein
MRRSDLRNGPQSRRRRSCPSSCACQPSTDCRLQHCRSCRRCPCHRYRPLRCRSSRPHPRQPRRLRRPLCRMCRQYSRGSTCRRRRRCSRLLPWCPHRPRSRTPVSGSSTPTVRTTRRNTERMPQRGLHLPCATEYTGRRSRVNVWRVAVSGAPACGKAAFQTQEARPVRNMRAAVTVLAPLRLAPCAWRTSARFARTCPNSSVRCPYLIGCEALSPGVLRAPLTI